jgi:hypothetical protein
MLRPRRRCLRRTVMTSTDTTEQPRCHFDGRTAYTQVRWHALSEALVPLCEHHANRFGFINTIDKEEADETSSTTVRPSWR